jgi:soluble lytic murein transglycosylase
MAGLHDLHQAEAVAAEVGKRCDDAEMRARALFLAGKYATAEKRYADAVRHFATLEAECPGSSLADDARLKRALCYRELGVEARFTELLTTMPDDYPGGDMVVEGLFDLAVRRLEKGDAGGAATVLERALSIAGSKDAERGQELAGRERYFHARALGALGETEKGLVEYEEIVRDMPLSYYMLLAYSRLEHADAERARRALQGAMDRARDAPFVLARRPELDTPGFVRALELLRIGDVEDASREMDALGYSATSAAPPVLWAVALLYERAGAAKLSHALTRGLSSDWLPRWPSGDWTHAWRIAFPRPYHEVVAREAKRNDLAEALVYAVMREESSFDPAAESPVQAYGLMQLIVPTARRFAKPLGLRADAAALQRPVVNVTLGCQVLGDLSRSFPNDPLLAIPGYNAGASRPRKWVTDHPATDFDLWVELIPFQETRRYTKRVLASRATYAFLYGQGAPEDAVRLPLALSTASAPHEPAKSASR